MYKHWLVWYFILGRVFFAVSQKIQTIAAELDYQHDNAREAQYFLKRLIATTRHDRDLDTWAMTYGQMISFLQFCDSIQLRYGDTALELYKRIGSREGKINMLWTNNI